MTKSWSGLFFGKTCKLCHCWGWRTYLESAEQPRDWRTYLEYAEHSWKLAHLPGICGTFLKLAHLSRICGTFLKLAHLLGIFETTWNWRIYRDTTEIFPESFVSLDPTETPNLLTQVLFKTSGFEPSERSEGARMQERSSPLTFFTQFLISLGC